MATGDRIVVEAPEMHGVGDWPADRRSSATILLGRLEEEARHTRERLANAERLRRWRVRWWVAFGEWPSSVGDQRANVVPLRRGDALGIR
jgi:hypothetical protein